MKKPIQQSFEAVQSAVQKAWSETVSSIVNVEDEMGQWLKQLKERSGQQTEEAQNILSDLARRLQQNTETMERRMEESFRSAFNRLKAPLSEELEQLRGRADQLARRIESQLKRRGVEPTDAPAPRDEGSPGEAAPTGSEGPAAPPSPPTEGGDERGSDG